MRGLCGSFDYPLLAGQVVLGGKINCRPLTWEYCSPSNPGTPQNCLRRFCGEPHSGFPPPLGIGDCPLSWKYCYPLPAGFPRNRSPLKGNPPFRGTPSALGQEGVRGRRLCGTAMLCRLQCACFAKRVAHCRRTVRQPSALIRSPPTFKRRQAACESLAGRLHSERDNIVSCDVPFGVFVIPSSKEKRRARGRSKQVHVIAAPKERLSCSKTLHQAVRQYA